MRTRCRAQLEREVWENMLPRQRGCVLLYWKRAHPCAYSCSPEISLKGSQAILHVDVGCALPLASSNAGAGAACTRVRSGLGFERMLISCGQHE